eukprot:1151358-Pelagomonas_calceolata.AAC.3
MNLKVDLIVKDHNVTGLGGDACTWRMQEAVVDRDAHYFSRIKHEIKLTHQSAQRISSWSAIRLKAFWAIRA